MSPRARQLLGRAFGWMLLAGVVAGTYLAYRWAEPRPGSFPTASPAGGASVTISLENTPFAGYANGHKSWSLRARRIDLERLPGSALTDIQSATLTDIREGVLYPAPPSHASTPSGDTAATPILTASASPTTSGTPRPAEITDPPPAGPPVATFHARQGRYLLGGAEQVPPDLALLYHTRWQFKLTGNVDLRTRAGDHLQSESLIILDMVNIRTHRPERRILCDSGAQVTMGGVHLNANQVRYDPAERTVECLGGVRSVYKEGTVQAERLFWSLKDQMIRCPETATGTLKKIPFTAEGLTIDVKRHTSQASHVHVRFRTQDVDANRLR